VSEKCTFQTPNFIRRCHQVERRTIGDMSTLDLQCLVSDAPDQPVAAQFRLRAEPDEDDDDDDDDDESDNNDSDNDDGYSE